MGKVLALLLIVVAVAAGLFFFVRRGFSTRSDPTSFEAWIAGNLRTWSVPAKYKDMRNPIDCTPQTLAEAKAHWADHCAACHANGGDGNSMLGRTMYPRPPRMAAGSTQSESDGELYYTIKNGVRLSGMPAFGDPGDNDTDSWKLVCFIRRMPKLTPEEIDEMKELNPKTPEDLEEEKQEREFLNGGTAPTPEEHHHH